MNETTFGIVGAGRAGSAMGVALVAAGYEVIGVTARSDASRRRAASTLPRSAIVDVDGLAEADAVILAVPDDALAPVASRLKRRPGQYVIHLSGAHGTRVLEAAGGIPVALHPPMTFAGTAEDAERIRGITFTATASYEARPFVHELVERLGARVQWVPEEMRAAYHAGLVHGANHLITLVAQALDILRQAGVEDPSATMRPLLTAALDNTLRSGHDALTGPIARGDIETVRAHLAALQAMRSGYEATYVGLARATLALVAGDGRLDGETAGRLAAVLEGLAVREELPRELAEGGREAPR